MLYLLSPAKSLDYETRVPKAVAARATDPLFVQRASELIAVLKTKSPAQVAQLMDLSDALATLNVDRYAAWQPEATPANSKPAILAFNGDVYEGLQAPTLKTADLNWAQQHLVLLSGLYGVLRPLDRLQPYRLEMGTALPTPRGKTLYAYWGDTIAQHLNQRQAEERLPVVVNLASIEYSRAALRPALRARVIDCHFEDWHGGDYKVISFFAKRARGLMARWAVQGRVQSARKLKEFSAEGYALDLEVSSAERLVFRRRQDAPA
jgi:cytoplasmic iron level regulating protein YaaA (DUF328/UPF0246 family)